VLGWVEVDQAVDVVAALGLAFLLFLGGLEIDFDRLRGELLRLAAVGYAVSFAIAVIVAVVLEATGLIETPLLVAIILLSLFFSGEGSVGSTVVLIVGLVMLAVVVFSPPAGPSARGGSRPTCSGSRTPPRRSACGARWCCWSALRPPPSRSGSRSSSAPSSPAPC
jgi:hypothetical protein